MIKGRLKSPYSGSRNAAGIGTNRLAKLKVIAVAYLFALPFLLSFFVFMIFPLISSLIMSFTDFRIMDIQNPLAVNLVGFKQYKTLLEDPRFLRSIVNTVYFVGVGIPMTIVVALTLAVVLNRGSNFFRSFFRVGFYMPVVGSIVAIAVVWRFLLQPDGMINTVLGWIGINGPDWLTSTSWAMPAMIIMAVWRNMGTLMIIFLAGLQGIPASMYEAAHVDGASPWKQFTCITIPLLRPTILVGAVLLSVGYLQFFEEPFVMTQGGPLGSTLSISYYTYNQFGFGNYGTASAASYLLFLAIASLSFFQFRLLSSKD